MRTRLRWFSVVLIAAALSLAAGSAAGPTVPSVRDLDMANLPADEAELSIVVDPNDPDHLAAGANARPGAQQWYVSHDGGRNWATGGLPFGTLTLPGQPSPTMSDPSVDFGSNGEIYYGALINGGQPDPCTMFVSASTDDGAHWSDPAGGIVATGTTVPLVCHDKEQIAVDRAHNDNVYIAWTPFGDANDRRVVFSRDLNGISDGLDFSPEAPLSDASCFSHGADIALTGSALYVAWTSWCPDLFADGDLGTVYVTKSTDQGAHWSTPVAASTLYNVDFTKFGFRGRSFPSIDVDPATGRVFVAYDTYADVPNLADADVMLVSSPDGSAGSWTAPLRVNQDSGTSDQWFPWLDVANGRVHVCFYTRAYDGGNINFDCSYGAVSATPALTELRVSSASTVPGPGALGPGDYNGAFAGADDVLHPAWGDGRSGVGGMTDAYTARIDFSPPSAITLSPLDASFSVVGPPAGFVATVTGAHGEPEAHIPVKFTVSSSGSPHPPAAYGNTNASGTALFSYRNTRTGVDTLHFWADLDEDGVQGSGETIDTTVTWTPGPAAAVTLTPATDTNVVDMTHTVTADVRDVYGNVVAPVTVRFSVSGANGVLGNPTSGSATTAGGLASFGYVGVLPGSDTISAFADSNGNGSRDPGEPAGTAAKAWQPPTSTDGGRATGSGTISPLGGGSASFSFAVQKKASDASPKGNLTYSAPGRAIVSTSITAVVVSGHDVTFFGTATLNGGGSLVFRVDMRDGGEPSSPNDRFRLRLGDGYDSGMRPLTSGNVQDH